MSNVLVLTHLGLGDMIHMNGLVRYIATRSDYVLVLCGAENLVNIKTMYQDNNKIKVVQVKDIYADIAKYNIGNYVDGIKITDTIRTGCWAGYNNFDDIPDCFYYSIGIDKNIRTRFFCLPSNIDQLTVPKIPFVFVQTVSSTTVNDTIITWDLDKTLTIDPNKNLYMKDHPFYDLADTYINKPFFSYINLLESAEQIHLLNSSFQCLSTYLKLKPILENAMIEIPELKIVISPDKLTREHHKLSLNYYEPIIQG